MDGNSFLSKQNKIFLTSAIILAILSLIGGVWLFFSLSQPQVSTAVIEEQPIITSIPTPEETPTPTSTSLIDFNSADDNFSVSYNPVRKLYQDTEPSGNRYTLYLSSGNFAIHAGTDWSWSYPNRTYTTDFLINNQPTFRYDINTQTIVDVQYNGKNYTIQCVHNGSSALKSECEQFLKNFKFI